METMHLDALQRVALDGLARQFYEVGARTKHWTTTPLPLRGRYGAWSTSTAHGIQTTELKFREHDLGMFHLLTRGNRLYNWSWYSGLTECWMRLGGSGREREECPPGPIPTELFERMWVTLHTGCRLYIAHFKLRPGPYAATVFARPRR